MMMCLQWFAQEKNAQGILVMEGAMGKLENPFVEKPWWDGLDLSEHVEKIIESGMSKKEAIKIVSKERGLPKREVYNAVLLNEKE
jgi:16S rRNA (cytidine1402-2'-O)-methyltransferase